MLKRKKNTLLIFACTGVAVVSFYSFFPILSEAKQDDNVQGEKRQIETKISEEKPLHDKENNRVEVSKQEKEELANLNGKKERPDKPVEDRPELKSIPGFKKESKRTGL